MILRASKPPPSIGTVSINPALRIRFVTFSSDSRHAFRPDLAAHIDGFIATAAHTLVIQADASAPVTGKAADVIACANTAAEAALRLVRPGKTVSIS